QPPAPDEPDQNLPWCVRQFGRQQCLRLKLSQRITDQNPTNLNRWLTTVIPDSRLSANFDGPSPIAIPVVNLQLPPLGFRVRQNLLQRRTTFALEPRTPSPVGRTSRRRIIKGGIQTKPGDQAHARQSTHQLEQGERRKAAVSNKDQSSIRQP